MRQLLKKAFEKFLTKSKSTTLRQGLLRLLYSRKGMQFQGWKNIQNRFYILQIDGSWLPSEQPLWNITREQFLLNCKRISLHYGNIAKGDVVVDIGAGLGEELVVYAALAGAEGKVYCVEPFPPAFQVLQQVIALNDLKQVHLLPFALYHQPATITIRGAEDSYSTVHIDTDAGSGYKVPAVPFDQLMEQVKEPVIHFMKVNIEGGEQYLLNPGFLPYFHRIKQMAIACHDFRYHYEGNPFFQTKDRLCRFFTDHGFRVRWQHTGEPFLDDWVYVFHPDL